MRKKLTIKQQRFVREIVKTGNGTRSALKAYDTTDYSTADSIAVENLQKPAIIAAIQEEFKKEDMNVEWVLKGQKKLAEGESVENHVKAKVLKDVGEYLSMYKDKGTSPVQVYGANATADELLIEVEELRSRAGKTRSVLPVTENSRIQSSERPASSKDL